MIGKLFIETIIEITNTQGMIELFLLRKKFFSTKRYDMLMILRAYSSKNTKRMLNKANP